MKGLEANKRENFRINPRMIVKVRSFTHSAEGAGRASITVWRRHLLQPESETKVGERNRQRYFLADL
jgi:hypothetical protein